MNEANEYLRCAAPRRLKCRVRRELTNQLPINKLRVRNKDNYTTIFDKIRLKRGQQETE